MAGKTKEKAPKEERAAKKDKREKKDKKEVKAKKSEKSSKESREFTLLASKKTLDPALSSLFAAKPTPPQRKAPVAEVDVDVNGEQSAEDGEVDGDAELSELEDEEVEDIDEDDETPEEVVASLPKNSELEEGSKRKRKRKDAEEDLEDTYMRKLAKEEERDAERDRNLKRRKGDDQQETTAGADKGVDGDEAANGVSDEEMEEGSTQEDDDAVSDEEDVTAPPPKHETLTGDATDTDAAKAARTVFLGNVSTRAITSKSARKTLLSHLASFFPSLAATRAGEPKHTVESIRFRSTPYDTKIPKKAAFAQKEVMNSTTHSTNAYAIYSSPTLAREAAKRLNGTTVLDRHLRVDEVAHPAKIDHRRCVFVGNLGFVDDETNILAADADAGHGARKAKPASDVEEGLWRFFGKCGTVESVRVVRDEKTRVGKGFAYVQFTTEEGVEVSLMKDGEKEPPMLPRKMRIMRAKAMKRNAKPESGRPGTSRPTNGGSGYQRKITAEEASHIGRAGKLYGRAAAAKMRKPTTFKDRAERRSRPNRDDKPTLGDGIKKPESFVFEGHRASVNKKPSLKLGGKKKAKVGKPTNRSTKRAAAFRASGGKKN